MQYLKHYIEMICVVHAFTKNLQILKSLIYPRNHSMSFIGMTKCRHMLVRLSTARLSNCQLYSLVNFHLYSCQTVICTPDRLSTVQLLGCKLYISCQTVNCITVRLSINCTAVRLSSIQLLYCQLHCLLSNCTAVRLLTALLSDCQLHRL